MRSDIISNAYYKDPNLDWLLWLTNDIVDPYYQWNLSEQDFSDYLIKKYGSVENSIRKIVFYRNNWYDDDKVLTPSYYENTLDMSLRKYYGPFYGKGTNVLYWKRKEEDWVQETNKIYKLTCNTDLLTVGDLIEVTNATAFVVGGGEITKITEDSIFIKNINGSFANGNVISETSSALADVVLTYDAITNDEGVFWSPVTYYDIENEKNAYNRSIRVMDSGNVPNAITAIRKTLKA